MKIILSAKEFSQETGYPLKTLRRLCRQGILKHWRSGRVYLLEKEQTISALRQMQENFKIYPMNLPRKKPITKNKNPVTETFADRIKRITKNKKSPNDSTNIVRAGAN